ncbi:ribosomal protein S5 domain 2-type protein [Hygrophoropsis aurantiaca]|uniref:Ribosomal protein S5 domain 2-type protein n=1 Tax=Hygrophoropsis aurantiaca TaxID=72124 RepID=A0ACB8AIW4_9AGAM|nr:ribosomal protein S5 domain 2-type protein [Hygrophoropsis aurantiaca]
MSATIVSSPGKVLAAGGYLVLDRAYSGIVISTSSRFYAVVQGGSPSHANVIVVRSPQFIQAEWRYSVSFENDRVHVERLEDSNAQKNKFVHLALQHTLALALEIHGGVKSILEQVLQNGLDIAVVGDNDFYSQRAKLESLGLPNAVASLSNIPPFSRNNVQLSDVHKTGMGSSAALITSLVSALLLRFSVISESEFAKLDSADRRLAHNTAQFIHCLAQGKVGSGFDVSAAVFGSQLYTRFDPGVLQPLMNDDQSHSTLIPVLTSPTWNFIAAPFQLPPLTRLVLADVDAGSDTPSFIGQVLKWRKENPEAANTLWSGIDQSNQSLARRLLYLTQAHASHPTDYESAVRRISDLPPSQWQQYRKDQSLSLVAQVILQVFYLVYEHAQAIRQQMRAMGEAANVHIEPPEQTALLDACMSQAGIICSGVPGAGGYDAIWLLVCDIPDASLDQSPLHHIEQAWTTVKDLSVSPLAAIESVAKGARVENIDDVLGLKEAITRD